MWRNYHLRELGPVCCTLLSQVSFTPFFNTHIILVCFFFGFIYINFSSLSSPNDISSYMVYAGRQQLNGWNMDETTHRILRVVVPLGYTDPHLGQDIALVELATAVMWSDRIQPICLPYANVEFSSDMRCMITGWGNIRDGGE